MSRRLLRAYGCVKRSCPPRSSDEERTLTSLVLIAAQGIRSDDDDWNRPQRRIGLNAAGRLITVEQRKLNIHQDEIRPFGHRGPYTRLAVFGFNYFETHACQKIAQDL